MAEQLEGALQAVRGSSLATPQDHTSEALQVVAQLTSDFRSRDKLYEQLDRVIFLENAVKIPKSYRKTAVEVRSPYPMHIVNTIVAALSTNPQQITYPQIGIGDTAAEQRARVQKFFEASWKRQEREANRRIFRMLMYSIVSKGEMIVKTIEQSKTAWGGYGQMQKAMAADLDGKEIYGADRDRITRGKTEEFKRGARYPIASMDILPETFYYLKGEHGFALCAEVQKVPYYSTLIRYKVGLDRQGKIVPQAMGLPRGQWQQVMGNTQTLRRIELWDSDECTVILQGPADLRSRGAKSFTNGVQVRRFKHHYGNKEYGTLRGPYFHAFGVTTNSREVHKQGLSVLYAFHHLFPMLDLLLTIQGQSAVSYGFPTFKRVTPPTLGLDTASLGLDSEEQEAGNEDVEVGGILPYDIAPIDAPRTSSDVGKMIADIVHLLELALPSAAQGLLQGDPSGYLVNQAAHLAKLAWNPIIDNVEFTMGDRVNFESELIGNIGERVYAHGQVPLYKGGNRRAIYSPGWLYVEPSDLKGLQCFEVELKPETPSNLVIEIRTHKEMLSMRLETPDMAIEAVGNDPVQVERGWLLHELKSDPQIRQVLKSRLMKKIATLDQETMSGIDKANRPGATPVATPNQGTTAPASPNGAAPMDPRLAAIAAAGAGGGSVGRMSNPNLPPGTPPGAPGGVRGMPENHENLPGEGL